MSKIFLKFIFKKYLFVLIKKIIFVFLSRKKLIKEENPKPELGESSGVVQKENSKDKKEFPKNHSLSDEAKTDKGEEKNDREKARRARSAEEEK